MIKSLIWVLNHPNNRNNKFKTILRLIWWKVNQIFFKFPSIVELKKDVSYIAYPDSSFGGLVVYTRLPEFYEMNYFDNIIETNDTVIDVGVHMGDYTLLAASNISSGQVLAFEPSKEALRVLSQNIAVNGYNRKVRVYPVVASDKNGNIDFVDNDRSEISHINFSKTSKSSIKVKTVKIDDVISDESIKSVKIIKIDVEGAELFVLKGMKESLSKGIIKQMLIEVNSDCENYGISPEDTFNFIKSFGYKLYYFDNEGKLKKLIVFPRNKKYINIVARF